MYNWNITGIFMPEQQAKGERKRIIEKVDDNKISYSE